MTAAALRVSVRKELRGLLPMWAGCMLALGVFVLVSVRYVYLPFGILIYSLGSIGLGAHAIGHEYGYRTLGLWLSQPSDRRALLLIKLAVLAPLLVTLGLAAFAGVVPALNGVEREAVVTTRMGILIGLSAFCLAPALTMLCRSGIAGMVFTLSIAGLVAMASEFLGGPIRHVWFSYTMLIVCALGALVGWRQFTRLEAIDGGGRDVHLPGFGSRQAVARVGPPSRTPIARLIARELRLQQMTLRSRPASSCLRAPASTCRRSARAVFER